MRFNLALDRKIRTTFERVGTTSDAGQATTEYILIIAVVVGFYLVAFNWLSNNKIGQQISNAVTNPFQAVYTYGHPQAKSLEDGAAYHPRAVNGQNSFRIFINPDKQS